MAERAQLEFPPDKKTESVVSKLLDRLLKEKIFNVLWDKVFYYFTFFQNDLSGLSAGSHNTRGFVIEFGGSGSVDNVGNTGLTIVTDTAANAVTLIQHQPLAQQILRWDRRQKFRVLINAQDITDSLGASDTNSLVYFTVGRTDTTVDAHYGFRIEGSTLQGTAGNGDTDAFVTLETGLLNSGINALEAVFLPGEKVIFSIADTAGIYIERGVITTALPSSDTTTSAPYSPPFHSTMFNFWVKTLDAKARTVNCTYFEYIQER